jgi:hypothetical protein
MDESLCPPFVMQRPPPSPLPPCPSPQEVKLLPPRPVEALQGCRAIAIAAGKSHNLAVTSDGAVFSWGDGSFGKLGHGEPVHLDAPTRIGALAGVQVVQVAAGRRHSLAVSNDGRAYCWGFADETLRLQYRQPAPEPQLPGANGALARSLSVCEVPNRPADLNSHLLQPAFETASSPPLLGLPPFYIGGGPPHFHPDLTLAVAPVGRTTGWLRA